MLDLIPYTPGEPLVIAESANASGALQFELQTIRPSEGIPAGGVVPGSSVRFRWKPSGTRMWVPSQSFVEFRIRTGANNAVLDADVAVNNIASAPLQAAAIIRGCSLTIGGNVIETLSDTCAQASAYLHRTSEFAEQVARGPAVGWNRTSRTASQPAEERRVDIRRSQIKTYMYQPPLGLFGSSRPMPSGDYELQLDIDSAAFFRALQPATAGASQTDASKLATLGTAVSTTAGIALLQAYFEITDVVLQAAFVDFGDAARVTGSFAYPITCLHLQKQILTSASDDVTLRVKPTSTRHTVAFQNAAAANGTANAAHVPTLFAPTTATGLDIRDGSAQAPAGAAGTNTAFNINSLQLVYAGHQSTQPALRLQYNSVEENMIRAYNHWREASGLMDPETYLQWLGAGPMYSFAGSNVRDISGRETDLRILVDRDSTAESGVMLVFSEYEAVVVLEVQGGETVDARTVDR